jgi:hypothetical protein
VQYDKDFVAQFFTFTRFLNFLIKATSKVKELHRSLSVWHSKFEPRINREDIKYPSPELKATPELMEDIQPKITLQQNSRRLSPFDLPARQYIKYPSPERFDSN